MFIYIYIYIYIYGIHFERAKVFRFYIESWPSQVPNPRPRAYRAHALNR